MGCRLRVCGTDRAAIANGRVQQRWHGEDGWLVAKWHMGGSGRHDHANAAGNIASRNAGRGECASGRCGCVCQHGYGMKLKPRGWLLLLACALVAGCASNLRTVGNAEAATMWHEARYRASCVGTGGPPAWCNGLRTALNGDEMEANAANAAQKVGKLPASAVARMKAIPGELEAIK